MFQVVLQIETRDIIGLFLLDAAVGKNVTVFSYLIVNAKITFQNFKKLRKNNCAIF